MWGRGAGWGRPNETQSENWHYQSDGGPGCLAIALIMFVDADVVISLAGTMPCDTRQEAQPQKENKKTNRGFV